MIFNPQILKVISRFFSFWFGFAGLRSILRFATLLYIGRKNYSFWGQFDTLQKKKNKPHTTKTR